MSTVQCPQCNQTSPFGVAFCGNCGFNIVSTSGHTNCQSCGGQLPPKAKFCGGCGSQVKPTAGISGSIKDGEWFRGDGEFVKRVDPEDMKSSWGGKSIKVPTGTVCAVLKDGAIDQIYSPGHKVAVGMMENLMSWFKGGVDASFYLIDCSPIPFATRVVRTSGNREQQIAVRMQAFLVQPNNQKSQLMRFLTSVVKSEDSVTTQDVYNLISKDVVATAKNVLSRSGEDFFAAEKRIAQELNNEIGSLYGLHFTANVETSASMYTINAHLGMNKVPQTVQCIKCQIQIPLTARFCGTCASRQPHRDSGEQSGELMPLITSDNRQLELDVVFQLQGHGDFGENDSLIPAIASAAAGAVRGLTATEAISADGIRKIQTEIRNKLMEQITGFQLKQVVVLDVKDKNGQWLLQARADVQRTRDQLEINKEWMKVEGEELELEKMALNLVLERQSLQLDQEFERIKIQQADELRRLENQQQHELNTMQLEQRHEQQTHDQNLNHALHMDQRDLKDALSRVALDDAHAEIDITNTNRAVDTNIAKDEAGRRLNRHMDEQDHSDNRAQYAREREILEQERTDQFADDKVELAHGQDMENMQMAHELEKERQTAEQNIWLKDQQVDSTIRTNEKMAESDNRIHLNQAKTEDEIDWMRAQTADKTRRMDIETQLFADKAHSDLAFEDDLRRNTMDQGNKQAEHDRDMEELQAQAKIAQDLAAQKQQHEQAMKNMDKEVDMARINAEHDKDVAVSQAKEAAAEARSNLQQEMYERMNQQTNEMFERMMRQQEMQNAATQQNMQALANAAAASAGVQQQQQQATIDAHKEAAAQARDMANASMSSMSNVAAAAAGNRPATSRADKRQDEELKELREQAALAQELLTEKNKREQQQHQASIGFHTAPQPEQEAATKASAKPSCASCGSINVGPKFCFDCGKPQ